jgi:hypothetical protein
MFFIPADIGKVTADASVEKLMKTSTNSNASNALSIDDGPWYREGSDGEFYFSRDWQSGSETTGRALPAEKSEPVI